AVSPPPPSSPQPDRPSSVITSTIVRMKRPQWAPAAWRSGASSGTATVVALMSTIFMDSVFRLGGARDFRHQPAIDANGLAGHEGSFVGKEESDDVGDFLRLAASAERVHGVDLAVERGGVG